MILVLCPLWAAAQEVRIETAGDGDGLRGTLRAASLSVDLSQDETAAAPQDYVAAARADYQRLLTALYSEGYYGGTISILVDGQEAASLDPLTRRASVSEVVLRVEPGPRFTFGRADIAPLPRGTLMPEAFATGQIARAGVISEAASAGVEAWREDGHALAAPADQSITARHPDQALDVAVALDPGPKLQFGTVSVAGNEAVRTARVLAIAGLPEGEVFSPQIIDRAERNLRRTGTFSAAAVIEADSADGGTLPLTVSVTEQKPRRLGFGAEYSSVSGLTLSGFWLHRNLLGGAERFRVEGEVTGLSGGTGGVDYSLGVSFLRPATFRQDNDFYIEAGIEQLDEPDFFQREVALETGIIRRIRNDDVIGEVGIGYLAGEISDDLGDRSYRLLTLPLRGTIEARNDPLDATSGYFATLEITPFLGLSGADDGARLYGDARIYRSVGEDDRITFAARGLLGSIVGADASDVPSDFLFYSGGGGTVRGQSYQSLSVDLGGGNEIGGTSFFATQLEARVGVTDTISVVGFYDAGFVGASALPFEDGDWHAGAGLGLRYDTGLGPIRLDVATPVSGPDNASGVEIYLGIGQSF